MAEVKFKTKEEVVLIPSIIIKNTGITLELTLEESVALAQVLQRIGGCEHTSVRFYTEPVNEKLYKLLGCAGYLKLTHENSNRATYFLDDTKKIIKDLAQKIFK